MRKMGRIGRVASLVCLALSACLVARVGFPQTASSPYTAGFRYNVGGLLVGSIEPYSGTGSVSYLATRNTYNSAGLLSMVEKGALSTWESEDVDPATWGTNFTVFQVETYGYDSMGRILWEQVSSPPPNGVAYKLTQYSYDVMERQQCVAVRMNPSEFSGSMPGACTLSTAGSYGPDRITYTTYDTRNHPLTIQRAYGTSLQETYETYKYTLNGLPQTVMDANGNLTTNSYDGLDRLSQVQFPSKTTPGTSSTSDLEQYTYDANSNRHTLLTRDSQTITYNYDNLNRLTSKLWPSSWGVSVYYGYDLRSLKLYANYTSSPTGPGVSYNFDGFGNLHSETVNLSGTSLPMSYQYDADGSRTQVMYPDGNYVQYHYDGLDRLAQVLESGSSVLVGYVYDSEGRVQQLSRGGGVTSTGFAYDPVSRLNALSHTLATQLDNVSYSSFSYNPQDQIVGLSVSNSEYDPLSNSATQSYTPNGLNQYASVGSVSFAWDTRANLTSDGSTTYAYDLENRLTGASGTHNASLSYDPAGRLYQTTSGSATTTLLYDGDRITAEYDGNGNLLRRYAYGLGGDDPLVWYEGSGFGQSNRRYLHVDHQGSIVAVTDTNGITLAVNQYDPYGLRNPLNLGRFQYTGQAYVPELGLYYYKARMYNPAFGRFMQVDPIGYKDDLNPYAYVGNDPMDGTDPTGREIRLQSHPVLDFNNHSKITIIPQNQAKYRDDTRFKNTLSDGRHYATIGAGPGGHIPGLLGKLVGGVNRDKDVDQSHNTSDEELKLPDGSNEDDMIEQLFAATANYRNDLDYALYPDSGHNEFNSNGFAHGLLNFLGFQGYHQPPGTTGFNIIVPPQEFKRPKITIIECPNGQCD